MVFLFISVLFSIQSQLTEVRNMYIKAIDDVSYADRLVDITKNESSGIKIAYHYTGLALQAKHSWNLATKMRKAKEAANGLNLAVLKDKANVEIRFLRFSFEANVPSLVGLTKHLTADKKVILKKIRRNHPLWSTMRKFLINSSELSTAEKEKIKNI
jgi:hypothetical protein